VSYRVTLIPGDGIGPEVVEAARRAVEATGIAIEWDRRDMGADAYARTGEALPAATIRSILDSGVALKGPVETPVTSGLRSVNVALRQELDLFACVRPCRLYAGVPSLYDRVDVTVIRENTEGMYTGIEFEMGQTGTKELIEFIHDETGRRIREDSGISIKAISQEGTARIVRFALDYARFHGRTLVTAGHKANIMKFTDGLFLEIARRTASEVPDMRFEDRIIDALCMQLIQAPDRFEVLVLPNLYGDIVSDLLAGLIGGLGMAPGAHAGDTIAVFEATHGTAPRLAGRHLANPMGVILSGAMLLRHLGEPEAGDRLEGAVVAVLAEGDLVTPDLRPPGDGRPVATTFEVAQAVAAKL
jgi:isocitrate dehydrogenase (NAD+)